ncbi:MAG: nuclear transport factor 2 family protein [Oscillospiraceae bacterium]|nr:nuclear transport factor 2 family protein [Oscillospiraceae bacterium]
MSRTLTAEEKLSRWEDVREIKNLVGRMSTNYTIKEERGMFRSYWSGREDVCLGINTGYFVGPAEVARYYDGEEARITAESAMIQAAFPQELGEKTQEEVHGVGMMTYKPVDTAVIEVAGDRQTAKGLWIIRGSYSRISTGGPISYWEWSWLAIDFVRENGEWKIWHELYLTEIDRPCGGAFVGPETAYAPRPEFAAAADIHMPEPTVKQVLREHYSATRPFAASPRIPAPYETFAETFSYGCEA